MREADLAVAVIADDLSGGADCAVAFAHAGLDVATQLGRAVVPPAWAQVAVVPTDSRDGDPERARAAVAEAVAVLARRRRPCGTRRSTRRCAVIRTSVGHGTAFDIAGTGKAGHLSLVEALRQAARLAAARD